MRQRSRGEAKKAMMQGKTTDYDHESSNEFDSFEEFMKEFDAK